MDPIRNHRKKTFIYLQISNTNALQYTNPTFRTNANSYQITQPINSIATNRGFSATEQRKQKFLFNITKSYTQTPYIVPKNTRQYSGSPLSPSFFITNEQSISSESISPNDSNRPEVERSIVKRLHWHILTIYEFSVGQSRRLKQT